MDEYVNNAGRPYDPPGWARTRSAADDGHAQITDRHGSTLDISADFTGVSVDVYPGEGRGDFDIPFSELPAVIAGLLTGVAGEGMQGLSARYTAMFTPPDGTALSPQYEVLWLATACLQRLAEHRDYETWDEDDCDDTDGILRELLDLALRLRPRLVPGLPDLPGTGRTQPDLDILAPLRAEALKQHHAPRPTRH